jgi:hypothetical protein
MTLLFRIWNTSGFILPQKIRCKGMKEDILGTYFHFQNKRLSRAAMLPLRVTSVTDVSVQSE